MENAGFESEAELDGAIKKIEESMKRARKKDLGEDAPPEVRHVSSAAFSRPWPNLFADGCFRFRRRSLRSR